MPPLPGLRTDEAALIGVKNQVSQPTVQQRTFTEDLWLFSPAAENFHRRVYGCLAREGRHLECRGRKPTAPHPPARWAASAQFTNSICSIEPPLNPFNRSLHQSRLDRIYSSCLTNYSPPKRLRPGNRGLAPTALKMPPLPGLRTDESALIGVKNQVSQPTVQQRTFTEERWLFSPGSRELSSKSLWLFSPGRGDILNAVGASPRPRIRRRSGRRAHSSPTQLVSSSRQLDPFNRSLHQLRLDRIYSS